MQAPTNGFFYVIDRQTGKPIVGVEPGRDALGVEIDVGGGDAQAPAVRREQDAQLLSFAQAPVAPARAVAAGAPNIERTDRLVKAIAAQKNMRLAAIDEIVATVDARLEANRKAAKK